MDKKQYDAYRVLAFIKKEKEITRSKLTRAGLGRFPHLNMITLYRIVNKLEADNCIAKTVVYIPGRPGCGTTVYSVTAKGLTSLRKQGEEVKKMLRRLK